MIGPGSFQSSVLRERNMTPPKKIAYEVAL
jgi:hypothetical protein